MNETLLEPIIPIQSDLFGGTVINPSKRRQKHQMPSLLDDMFETPNDELYYPIINKVKLLGQEPPELDVFASDDRGDGQTDSKCTYHLTKEYDSLNNDWLIQPSQRIPTSVWVNDPHSMHKESLEQLVRQYKKYGFTVVQIMPSNTRRTTYWHELIEPFRFGGDPKYKRIRKYIHNFPWKGTVTFLKDGKPTVNTDMTSKTFGMIQSSRNAYEVLVWLKCKSKFANHYS